jgi:zinc protease
MPVSVGLTEPAGYVPDSDDLSLDLTMPAVRETRLDSGLRVATLETPARTDETPVVVRLRIPGGSALDGERPGVARFAGEMLTRGSGGRTLEDLAEELDGLGASITVGVGRESTDIVATSLREDIDTVAGLMASALFEPDFPEQQMQIVRGQILSGLRQAKNDTRSEADHLLRSMLYPAGHPYRDRVSGDEESITAITRDDLLAYRERAYRPSRAIVAVGGLTHDEAVHLVADMFSGWHGELPALVIPGTYSSQESSREIVEIAGKSQADLALGAPALARSDPDYYALNVANLIFGRLGLMGRIGESVRERQGMAYYAYSGLEAGIGIGFWSARAGVNPANIDRALDTILAELRQYLQDGPTEREYVDAVGYLTGSLPLGLETVGSLTQVTADIVFSNLGTDYLQRYRSIIRNLSADQLIETMRKYVDPDRLAIAVAKPKEA